jgi:hypothetical protein
VSTITKNHNNGQEEEEGKKMTITMVMNVKMIPVNTGAGD